jgi:hypothetical protein
MFYRDKDGDDAVTFKAILLKSSEKIVVNQIKEETKQKMRVILILPDVTYVKLIQEAKFL